MLTGPEAMPVFSDTTVTPAQKRAIIAYITRSAPSRTPAGSAWPGRPVTEGLVAFLGGIAVLVFVAIWITMKKRREA
jgi:ubiquinol-cytochrome c reductase cytochrome c subunit